MISLIIHEQSIRVVLKDVHVNSKKTKSLDTTFYMLKQILKKQNDILEGLYILLTTY